MVDSVRFEAKRVWVVAKGYRPEEGGMQTYAEGVAEAYAAMGAAVTVFTQTSAGPHKVTDESVHLVDIGPGKGPAIPFRFGIAIADAMAAGAAVVVGEEGGAQELLKHSISGLVVAGSDTSSIAAALRKLLTQESFRRELAEAGQRRAQSLFTWQRHVQSINEAFAKNG